MGLVCPESSRRRVVSPGVRRREPLSPPAPHPRRVGPHSSGGRLCARLARPVGHVKPRRTRRRAPSVTSRRTPRARTPVGRRRGRTNRRRTPETSLCRRSATDEGGREGVVVSGPPVFPSCPYPCLGGWVPQRARPPPTGGRRPRSDPGMVPPQPPRPVERETRESPAPAQRERERDDRRGPTEDKEDLPLVQLGVLRGRDGCREDVALRAPRV